MYLAFEKLPAGALSASTRAALDAEFGPDWPDVEYVPFDNDLVSLPTDGRNYASSLAALVAPFSRGNVTIASNDTLVNPVVNPNFLLDVRDQEVAVAAFKRARQIFATAPLKSIVNRGVEFSPGANITSDADIFQVIMETASTISHAAGTCAMGMNNDTSAVIDSHARVIGVQGLRVVDASSFPFLPPGHPQGTVCESKMPAAPAVWFVLVFESFANLTPIRRSCGEDRGRDFEWTMTQFLVRLVQHPKVTGNVYRLHSYIYSSHQIWLFNSNRQIHFQSYPQ